MYNFPMFILTRIDVVPTYKHYTYEINILYFIFEIDVALWVQV